MRIVVPLRHPQARLAPEFSWPPWASAARKNEPSSIVAFDPIYRKAEGDARSEPRLERHVNRPQNNDTMKKQTKSTKIRPQTTPATAASFAKWLRSIPQGPDEQVTIQPPIRLTQSQWAMLAIDASRQKITLNELLQGSVNTFAGMVQEDLIKAA
jgi:hypothetical protein